MSIRGHGPDLRCADPTGADHRRSPTPTSTSRPPGTRTTSSPRTMQTSPGSGPPMGSPVSASQRRTWPASHAEEDHRPGARFGEARDRLHAAPMAAAAVRPVGAPVAASHRCTAASWPAPAITTRPSGRATVATSQISDLSPVTGPSSRPVATSSLCRAGLGRGDRDRPSIGQVCDREPVGVDAPRPPTGHPPARPVDPSNRRVRPRAEAASTVRPAGVYGLCPPGRPVPRADAPVPRPGAPVRAFSRRTVPSSSPITSNGVPSAARRTGQPGNRRRRVVSPGRRQARRTARPSDEQCACPRTRRRCRRRRRAGPGTPGFYSE